MSGLSCPSFQRQQWLGIRPGSKRTIEQTSLCQLKLIWQECQSTVIEDCWGIKLINPGQLCWFLVGIAANNLPLSRPIFTSPGWKSTGVGKLSSDSAEVAKLLSLYLAQSSLSGISWSALPWREERPWRWLQCAIVLNTGFSCMS